MEKLILSSGSIASMSNEELRAGIEQLRAQREALVNEARKVQGSNVKPPRGVRPPKEKDPAQVALLKMLKGEA